MNSGESLLMTAVSISLQKEWWTEVVGLTIERATFFLLCVEVKNGGGGGNNWYY